MIKAVKNKQITLAEKFAKSCIINELKLIGMMAQRNSQLVAILPVYMVCTTLTPWNSYV